MAVAPGRSPLAPERLAELPPLAGVRLAAGRSGIRYHDRDDLLLAVLAEGTAAAGVFTRSLASSAPVDWCRAHIGQGRARALLVNAGNANAFTGKAGERAVKACARGVARRVGCLPEQVFAASTGVIGEPLPVEAILAQLDAMAAHPGVSWRDAAEAIRTTDTYPKLATASARLGPARVTVNGIAKGSGMIAPDMATLLAFVFTDAALPARLLRPLLAWSAAQSFNCITVDGDTSTSDTLLLFASGRAGPAPPALRSAADRRLDEFRAALDRVTRELAQQVVRDGEGAEKFVSIAVTGARSGASARRIALAIGNSPLVKTAIAGADANWGRIVMAVGKSGEPADRDRLAIWIGGASVASRGMRDPAYREAEIVPHMRGRDIAIRVDVGVGRGSATVWTCDLTHRYIDINADYRS